MWLISARVNKPENDDPSISVEFKHQVAQEYIAAPISVDQKMQSV
jgi:hypothetical protein